MDRRPSDRVLEEWDSVTRNVQRPAEAPRRRRTGGGFLALAPLLAGALVVAVGVMWLGGREAGVGGPTPTPSAPPTPSAITAEVSPSATPLPTVGPSTAPTPTLTATLTPTPGYSDECDLKAAITAWEGAAGSRIATIQLTNAGPLACSIPVLPTARLVDGTGRVLAQIENPMDGATTEVQVGDVLSTAAQVANVCGAPPKAPVTIQLEFLGGRTTTATPLDPTDATVPPCNGPSQPSEMSIHPWSR